MEIPVTSDSSAESRNGKKRPRIAIILTCVFLIVALITAVYVTTALSYSNKFLSETTIDGVPVSKMTVDEAIATIDEGLSEVEVTLIESGEDNVSLYGSDISLTIDETEVSKALSRQNPWSWPFASKNKIETGEALYDASALEDIVNNLDCVSGDDRTSASDASIRFDVDSSEFVIVPARSGTTVATENLAEAIVEMMLDGGGVIDVVSLYEEPEVSADSPEINDAMDKIEAYLSKRITYDIDGIESAVTLDDTDIANLITIGDDGYSVSLSEESVAEWLRSVGKEYDTVGTTREYTTAYGKNESVTGGTYGWMTDEAAMLPKVIEDLESDEVVMSREFEYERTAARAKDSDEGTEWGDRYVDLDLTDQKVRLVEGGKVIGEFVTVTGSNDGRHNTLEGVYYITNKNTDYTMTGADENGDGRPDYRTFTEYFDHFYNGCAFHALSSRTDWSPTAWLKGNGSHGCANLSLDDARTVHEFVEVGTPVVVHM